MLSSLLVIALLQDPDPKEVQQWVQQLSSEDLEVRESAAQKLVACGEKVLPILLEHEKTASPEAKARIADIRLRLTPLPPGIRDVLAAAKVSSQRGAKIEEWGHKLKNGVNQYLDFLKVEADRRSFQTATDRLQDVFGNLDKGEIRRGEVNVRGTQAYAENGLHVCESGSFGKVEDEILICLGDLRVEKMKRSIVIVVGDLEASGEVEACIVFAIGTMRFQGQSKRDGVEECTIQATRGVEGGYSEHSVYVNVSKVKLATSKGDRQVSLPKPEVKDQKK